MSKHKSPLAHAVGAILPALSATFILSLFVNAVILVSPIYSMQVYDRVLNSRNLMTLAMLSAIAQRRRNSECVEPCRLQLECAAVLIEDAPLIGERRRDVGPVRLGLQRRGNCKSVKPGIFSREPCLQRQRRVELLAQRFRRGARLRGVDPEQHLALLHMLGLLDEDVLDDAALEMLDRLAIALDRDPGRRDGRRIERGPCGPQAERSEDDAD